MNRPICRPLLRAAALAAGSLVAACGSGVAAPNDPVPLPGNPKGSHFDQAASGPIASGTITLVDGKVVPGSAVFVSVRVPGASGPPLAAKKLPAEFPLTFELTAADRPMVQGPIPDSFELKARLDGDGDPMTKTDSDPVATVIATKGQAGLTLGMAPANPQPAKPTE